VPNNEHFIQLTDFVMPYLAINYFIRNNNNAFGNNGSNNSGGIIFKNSLLPTIASALSILFFSNFSTISIIFYLERSTLFFLLKELNQRTLCKMLSGKQEGATYKPR